MLLAMLRTAQKTTKSQVPASPDQKANGTIVHEELEIEHLKPNEDGLLVAELQSMKDEKLAVIRRALENGDYDSDEILEAALDRMLERMKSEDREH
jgi:anti-sigma28 factor (negative regulator of flagellin synthesis)